MGCAIAIPKYGSLLIVVTIATCKSDTPSIIIIIIATCLAPHPPQFTEAREAGWNEWPNDYEVRVYW